MTWCHLRSQKPRSVFWQKCFPLVFPLPVASLRQWGCNSGPVIILDQQCVFSKSTLISSIFSPLMPPYFFVTSSSSFTADISWAHRHHLGQSSVSGIAALWNWTLLPPPTLDPQQSWNVINEMRWDSPECPEGQWEPAVVTKVHDFNASW